MINRTLLVALAILAAACGSSTPTTPSTTTPATSTATTAAAPTITETWNSTLPVGGSKFYSFSIAQNGTVNLTLASVGGNFVPATVTISLGIGQPSGNDCATTSSLNVNAQTPAPQLTGTYGPGVFCVKAADVGNLFAPASFSVVVAHP